MVPAPPSPFPFVTIVTVVRDDVAGLRGTHASLRAQEWRDFSWVVVDGASRDGSADFLATLRDEIAWFRSAPDDGLYDAMNIGLAQATGTYVLFLNAGDTLAGTDTLARIATTLRACTAPDARMPDFVYGDALLDVGTGESLYKPARSHRLAWYGMFTQHQAMLYRRGALGDLRFRLTYPIGADYAFTLEALARARSVRRLSFPVCIFAGGGRSEQSAGRGRHDQWRIRREVLALGPAACAAIAAVQCAAMAIRRRHPTLFARLRCRNSMSREGKEAIDGSGELPSHGCNCAGNHTRDKQCPARYTISL